MRKIVLLAVIIAFFGMAHAQNAYWVFFTDKNNTTFDPYSYFDAKAIERYQVNHADLYDITNYPVNQEYEDAVNAATTENIGESRWLNAVAVTATEEQIALVKSFPFVLSVQEIASEASTAQAPVYTQTYVLDSHLHQVSLMQGEKFLQKNINGKGVRIAVFDGGFPDVDTHSAFKHLRDNHQIIKTWNFANKKENVYGYNQHGCMVLSCIAGILDDTTMLGLAPGAEFLLARTEVETEKKKEEVWWVQALEWADQNGASIVSSSLGYGKELHNLKDMNGTSIVAKGAATAVSKGILVCTAMGNEGSDGNWKMLVTPADADGVLSVGAVNALDNRESYSSFGPTADGRRKPNVVACGNDMVAMSKGDFAYAQGTSFATPMVSGFAACVKQMHPEWTAQQLLEEIEKSANHYPYYDYAYGYGVPQAGYFTDGKKESVHAFDLAEDDDYLYIIPVNSDKTGKLFYNIQNGDGSLEHYDVLSLGLRLGDVGETYFIDSNKVYFNISKDLLENGQKVNLWYGNQYAQYVMGKDKVAVADTNVTNGVPYLNMNSDFGFFRKSMPDKDIFNRKPKRYSCNLVLNASFMLPTMWPPQGYNQGKDGVSRSFTFSFVNNWQLARVYGLGFRVGFGSSWYSLHHFNTFDYYWPNYSVLPGYNYAKIKKHNLKTTKFDLELYQRFILANVSMSQLYLETGVFGEWITGARVKTKMVSDNGTGKDVDVHIERRYALNDMHKLDCGVRLRLGFTNICAIYGQYRITNIMKNYPDLPKWEIGLQFNVGNFSRNGLLAGLGIVR